MLLSQNGCWRQHGHLLPGRDRLEDGPDRHFGLAETDITADKPVHRLAPFHIPFHISCCFQLIRGGFIGERFLQFPLPGTIDGEGEAVGLLPFGVELHQIKGDLADGFLRPLLGFAPGGAAHFAELRRRFTRGAITPEAAQLVGRNAQDSIRVLHNEVVTDITGDREFLHGFEAADPVVAMNHVVARSHLVRINGPTGCLAASPHVAAGSEGLLSEEFPIGDQCNAPRRQLKALEFSRATGLQRNRGVLLDKLFDGRAVGCIGDEPTDAVVLLQQGHSSTRLSGNKPDSRPNLLETLDQLSLFSELIRVGRHRPTGQVEAVGMVVLLQEFCQIKTTETVGLVVGLIDASVQQRRPELIGFLLGQTTFSGHFAVMNRSMLKPLLAMGKAVAPFINHHSCALRQVVEQ